MAGNKETGQRRVTMMDVGLEAGVGQTTVSFIMNGHGDKRISEETRNRVIKAAKKLGYKPRKAGRPPSSGAHGVIGVMFDEVATTPFASITIEGAQERAWDNNIIVQVVMTGGNKEYETAVLRNWSADRVLGVVYSSIVTRSTTAPASLSMHKSVLLNCYEDEERFPSIVPADKQGGEAATKALIDAGHKKIAFISGEMWTEASALRQEGYQEAMRSAGLEVLQDFIIEGNFQTSGGRLATIKLMSGHTRPDAIFCANDLMAIGCYEALKELGLKPGTDVAVMGYDDMEVSKHLNPPLSTVLLPHREMGQWAIDSILSKHDQPIKQSYLKCPLVLRKSHLNNP